MMAYPMELTLGDKACETSDLSKFFKKRKWDFTWDFDHSGYWHEIMLDGVIVMQIEFDVSVEELVKTIKEFVPDFDEQACGPASLVGVKKLRDDQGGRGGLYVYSGDAPKWEKLKRSV